MLSFISLGIVAFAVSLDGFGVGVTYGLRKIRIPNLSIAIISCCSGLIIYASMHAGVYISQFMQPFMAKVFGSVILISIGFWAVIQVVLSKNEVSPPIPQIKRKRRLSPYDNIRSQAQDQELSLLFQILRSPLKADKDHSGTISSSEAAVLGFALSLDALGAGIGAAFMGFMPWLTALTIAAASGLFIGGGLRVGSRFADMSWVRKLTVLPGCILVIMGILKLM